MNFEEIKSRWNWKPIRDCPGRFVLRGEDKTICPAEVAGTEVQFGEFKSEKAKDMVIVGQINGGGLISYKKTDGTYLHALNTTQGFERKLAQLGIKL